MERAITYEGTTWQVLVNPAPAGRDAESGLELLFKEPRSGRTVPAPIGRPLLRALSREGLELDEELLRSELRAALERTGAGGAHTGSAESRGDG